VKLIAPGFGGINLEDIAAQKIDKQGLYHKLVDYFDSPYAQDNF